VKLKKSCLLAGLMLAGASSVRGAFRASDQVVLLGAARTAGAAEAFWLTDVTIFNPGPAAANVDIVFLPTGGTDNTAALSSPVRKGPLSAGQTLLLSDVLGTVFGLSSGGGALLFFGSQADAPGLVAPLIVTGRVYDDTGAGTYSMSEPGLPYYDEANPAAAAVGADVHVLTGLEEDENFRTNVGVWNGSDPTTSIRVRLEFSTAAGLPAATTDVFLPPLAHFQVNGVLASLGLSGQGFTAKASLLSSSSASVSPRPYFFAFGAVIDNRTNDPIFLEPAYLGEEPVNCIFQ
jgi:hypothetical protein